MDIGGLLTALETSQLAVAIQQSSWAFQAIETVHVLAFSVVVGTILVVDLRLLGLASRTVPVREAMADSLRWTWGGFVVAVISGILMFLTKATIYFDTLTFKAKMLLLLLAGINMMVFHLGIYRSVSRWGDACVDPPLAARVAGGLSLTLWIAIIICGRWIGFSIGEAAG